MRAGGPWYVAPGGSDANNCLSPAAPCAGPSAPIGKPGFVPGDTIYVAEGTYTRSPGAVFWSGTDVQVVGGWNLAFTSQTGTTVLDGRNADWVVYVSGGNIRMRNLTIRHGNAWSYEMGAITNGGASLTLDDCVVTENSGTDPSASAAGSGTGV